MISAPVPSDKIIENYGLAVWLVVIFVLGLMVVTWLLVRHLLKEHAKERQDNLEERKGHQEFFSSAIKANTEALVRTAETLSEASGNIRHSMDALARVEQLTISVKEDHNILNATQLMINNEVHNLAGKEKGRHELHEKSIESLKDKIEGLEKLQENCQKICERRLESD